MRLITFVIVTDTFVRIINLKYYGDSVTNILNAVREMGDLGAHFVVGGRLDQSKDVVESISMDATPIDEVLQSKSGIYACLQPQVSL